MLVRQSMVMSLRSFWVSGRRIERAGYLVGALLLISSIVHIAILAVTGASWVGPLSLRKPAAFGLSFGITLVTIVWVASFLPLAERDAPGSPHDLHRGERRRDGVGLVAGVARRALSFQCGNGVRRAGRASAGGRRHCARGCNRRDDRDGVPPESGRADRPAGGRSRSGQWPCASRWRPARR